MEKVVSLEPKEQQAFDNIGNEIVKAWANVGIFSEQLDQARRSRDQALEQQRGLVKQTLASHGYAENENWNYRLVPGGIAVTLPDTESPEIISPPASRKSGNRIASHVE